MKTIIAKFNVAEITQMGNGGGGKVTLFPVIGGDNPENDSFWKATPAGKIEMYIDNPAAMEAFEFGEYYVEFKKVTD